MTAPRIRRGRHARSCALLAVLTLVLACTTNAVGAEPAPGQGVAFVATTPPALKGTAGAAARVEVFNGSSAGQTVRLRADGAPVTVSPSSVRVGAGGIATFTVTLDRSIAQATAAELLTHSTDGTLARSPMAVGPSLRGSEAEVRAGYPKSIDFGTVDTGDDTNVSVTNLPGTDRASTQVGHVSGAGKAVAVRRKGDTLRLAPISEPGEYSGTVDLTPGTDGGEVAVTAKARRGVWLAAAILIIVGLGVALALEYFVTTVRPKLALRRRLGVTKANVLARQQTLTRALQERQEMMPAGRTGQWAPPLIYVQDDSTSLVQARGDRITSELRRAATGPQRDKWGPDGAEVDDLDKQIAEYEGLAGELTLLATEWSSFVVDARPEDREIARDAPMADLVDATLSHRILSDRIVAEREHSKAALALVAELRQLYRRLARLEDDARKDDLENVAADVAEKRAEVLHTFATADEAEEHWKSVDEFNEIIHGVPDQTPPAPAPAPPGPPTAVPHNGGDGLVVLAAPERHRMRREVVEEAAVAEHAPAPTSESLADVGESHALSALDVLFVAVSAALAAASGLVTLYFDNDTFGSTGDYIGLVVWGATATAGLALVRRIVPASIKSS